MVAGRLGDFRAVCNDRADSVETVGGDAHADAGTAQQDAAGKFAFGNGGRHRRAEIRIVILWIQFERTEILRLESKRRKERDQLFFHFESAVIGRDPDSALRRTLPVCDFLHLFILCWVVYFE